MIENYIKNHSFFHGWKEEYINHIIEISSLQTFPKNQRIIEEGFFARFFYIIVTGLVEVKEMDIVLQMLGPGEVVGWSWLIPPYTWNFSVDTVKDTIAIVIDSEKLKELFLKNKEIECLVYKSMFFVVTNRLRGSRQKIVELCLKK